MRDYNDLGGPFHVQLHELVWMFTWSDHSEHLPKRELIRFDVHWRPKSAQSTLLAALATDH